jgi:hypothetical protein
LLQGLKADEPFAAFVLRVTRAKRRAPVMEARPSTMTSEPRGMVGMGGSGSAGVMGDKAHIFINLKIFLSRARAAIFVSQLLLALWLLRRQRHIHHLAHGPLLAVCRHHHRPQARVGCPLPGGGRGVQLMQCRGAGARPSTITRGPA